MRTLQQIKDEYAQEFEHEDFENLLWFYADSEDGIDEITRAFDEVAKRYATEVAQQALKDAAERAKLHVVGQVVGQGMREGLLTKSYVNYSGINEVSIFKQSILDTEIKLP